MQNGGLISGFPQYSTGLKKNPHTGGGECWQKYGSKLHDYIRAHHLDLMTQDRVLSYSSPTNFATSLALVLKSL